MPGHSTGAPQMSHLDRNHAPSSRPDKYRQIRTISRDSTTSQNSYNEPHGDYPREHHTSSTKQYPETKSSRGRSHARNGTGRSTQSIGFIPGSADGPSSRPSCGSCSSMGWSGCKALICCVLTCGFYGGREPCLPVSESSTDHTSKSPHASHPSNGVAITNPTGGVTVEHNNSSKVWKMLQSESFRYPDVRIGGKTVKYPVNVSKPSRTATTKESPPREYSTLLRDDYYDRDEQVDSSDIDSLITKKLLELYAWHQIDQLAKCTSDSSFSLKTNEISELIYNIAKDYNLEEQEAECKLVHGVIRLSTRKGKRNKSHQAGQRLNGRSDRTLPDSGNETMTTTFKSSDYPEVKVSERTPSDELARRMRPYSGKAYSSSMSTAYHHDTERNSSNAPLLI